jgi:hypothetical protein
VHRLRRDARGELTVGEPKLPTVKRLFNAVSRCAFPGCATPAIDPASGSVLLEVCHIHGDKEKAARFVEAQTDEQRQAYENLLLLCGVHHKIVDDNEDDYPAELLRQMKAAAERRPPPTRPPESAAEQALQALRGATIHGPVVVGTVHGQVAHTINNYAPPVRRIGPALEEQMVRELAPIADPSLQCNVGGYANEPLLQDLTRVLKRAGWNALAWSMLTPMSTRPGLWFRVPVPTPPAVQQLVRTIEAAGLTPRPAFVESHPRDLPHLVVVTIGPAPA